MLAVFKKNFYYIYSFLRDKEKQSTSGGGADREGDTESEAGSRLWAVSTEPAVGLKSQTSRSWPEPKSDVQPTELARCPNLTEYFSANGNVGFDYALVECCLHFK